MKYLIALIFGLALTCRAGAASDGSAWFKNLHRSYTGFAFGDGTIKTISYDMTWIGPKGKIIESDHLTRDALAYRDDAHYVKENTNDSAGFTGSVFWYSDENGFPTKLIGNEVSTRYATDLVETDAITAVPWNYRKDVTESGATLAVVRATLSTGISIDLYIDRATGAYKRVVIDPEGAYQTTLRDITYGEVGPGLKFMSGWKSHDDAASAKNFVLNPIVSDSDLRPPAQTAKWTFGTQPMPIDQTHKRIVIHATVDGVLGTFLLDTGAAGIFLSGDFARRAHLKPIGHGGTETLYGSQRSDIGRVGTFQFGDSTLSNVIVYYGMPTFDTWGPDGLIGYGALAGAHVSLDLKHSTLTLSDASQLGPSPPGGVTVPAGFADGQPTISMMLNKSLELDTIVDTGNPGGVLIPFAIVQAYGLHFSGTYCGNLDALSVGTIRYDSPRACLATGEGRWVLAGMDFLKQFDRVDFDYPVGDIIFYPKKP